MENSKLYNLSHKMLDIFKDTIMYHRKMTSFQKIVVFTFLVGGFLIVFKTLWFLCVTLTYCACLYGSVSGARYLTQRRSHLGSDFLLTSIDKLQEFVAHIKSVPLLTSTTTELVGLPDTSKHVQQPECELDSSTDNDSEHFFDANDVADDTHLQHSVSHSTFYFNLDDTNNYNHDNEICTDVDDRRSNSLNDRSLRTISRKQNGDKHNEREINSETLNIVTQAFDDLSKLILRDFIKSWYDLVSEDRESLNEADHILQIIIDHIQERFGKLDVLQTAMDLIHMFRYHVCVLKQSKLTYKLQSKRRRSSVKSRNKEENISPKLSLHPFLFKSVEESYNSKVDFHIALKSKEMEKSYLNAIVEVLLINLLPEELHKSKSVVCALREVLTGNILYHIFNLLSDPTFIHEKIVQITSDEIPGISNESVPVVISSTPQITKSDLRPSLVRQEAVQEKKPSFPSQSSTDGDECATDTTSQVTRCSAVEEKTDLDLAWKDDTKLHLISTGMCNECNRLCSKDKDNISPRVHTCSLGTTRTFFDSTNSDSVIDNTSKSSLGGSPPITFSIGDTDIDTSMTEEEPVFHDIPVGQECLQMDSGSIEESLSECQTPLEVHEVSVSEVEVPELILPSQITVNQEAEGDSSHSQNIPQDDLQTAAPRKPAVERNRIFPNISVPSIPNIFVPSMPSIPNFSVPNNIFNFQFPQFPPFRKPSASVSEANRSAVNLNTGDETDTEVMNIRKSKSSTELSVPQSTTASLQYDVMPSSSTSPSTFQDAFITSTETAKEAGSGSQYTLYLVQYEALYHSEDNQLVHRTGVVKRRFREFVNLQSRLEDNPVYKRSMRDVKGPRKLVSLPFFNMDKESIDSRKKLLETFLSALIKKDDICNGDELKTFLGYSGDGHIAFVRKVPENTGPRIDQMLVKKMSGVFDKIVEVLPSLPQELPRIITKAEVKEDEITTIVTVDTDNIDASFDYQDDKNVCRHVQNGLDRFVEETAANLTHSVEEATFSNTTLGDSMLEWQERLLGTATRMAGDGSEVPEQHSETAISGVDPTTSFEVDKAPLSSALLDLLAELLQGHGSWVCHDSVMHTGNIVIGRALDRYLQTKIEYLTSQEMSSFYMRTLQGTLWPDGVLSQEHRPVLTDLQRDTLKKQATRCLGDFLPGVLKVLLGEEEFDVLMEEIMDSVKYEKINRHFWYTLFDVVIEKIFPEVATEDLHRKLSTASYN